MLSETDCKNIIDRVVHFSSADETECLLSGGENALTRFANNVVHQNVAEQGNTLSVRAIIDGRQARATTSRFDDESLRQVVDRAVEIARLMDRDEELLPVTDPVSAPRLEHYDSGTAQLSPEQRADAVRQMVSAAQAADLVSAGIFESGESYLAIGNSKGHFCYYRRTGATISTTMTGTSSSGYILHTAPSVQELDPATAAQTAARKALESADPIEVEPGDYTVILEPQAVANLVPFLLFDYVVGVSSFSYTGVSEKKSYLTDRIGTQLFGSNITLVDDAYHPLQVGPAFDYEGVPKKRVVLIENGVAKGLVYSRLEAKNAGVEPTGHGLPLPNTYGSFPSNIVLAGGDASLDEMIASTERGILVSRFWYIRFVDSARVMVTGMTRDGTFLIENGKVTRGIKNMRFNESLIAMLNNVSMLSPAVRTSDDESETVYVVPAMKVDRFHFSSTTKF
jgi:predicted Zn-dependent protease